MYYKLLLELKRLSNELNQYINDVKDLDKSEINKIIKRLNEIEKLL